MKRSKDEIIHILRQNGYVVTRFSLRLEGKYTVEDASWNYRDAIAHLSHIHPQVKNIPIVVDDDKLASIFLQRVWGIRFPLGVIDYETTEHTQTTFFAWGFFVVVVENHCYSVPPDHAGVATNYHLCSPRLFWLFHPLLRWILKRNYRLLMSQDVPLRERRGVLREWGYSFKAEDHNRNYLRALNLTLNHVIPPAGDLPPVLMKLNVEKDLPEGKRVFVGRDDHVGFQFLRQNNELFIYPRMCPHQGASLDCAPVVQGKLQCVWHGRLLSPLAKFDLSVPEKKIEGPDGYCFELRQGALQVSRAEA